MPDTQSEKKNDKNGNNTVAIDEDIADLSAIIGDDELSEAYEEGGTTYVHVKRKNSEAETILFLVLCALAVGAAWYLRTNTPQRPDLGSVPSLRQ